jgi:hypothetical protein
MSEGGLPVTSTAGVGRAAGRTQWGLSQGRHTPEAVAERRAVAELLRRARVGLAVPERLRPRQRTDCPKERQKGRHCCRPFCLSLHVARS